jgi:hypothetical protein
MEGNTFAQNQTANQVKLRMHETQICQRCQRQVPCKSEKGFAPFDPQKEMT